jgi:hypothetical protein
MGRISAEVYGGWQQNRDAPATVPAAITASMATGARVTIKVENTRLLSRVVLSAAVE